MKRDFELVRTILMDVQKSPAGSQLAEITIPDGCDKDTLYAHIELLIDANLLEGKVLRSNEGIAAIAVRKLTWEGHDFIQAAESDGLWKKAFATVKENGGAMTFDVLKELLKKLALTAAGLS